MNKPDYILISVVGILIVMGIVILASVSSAISQERFGSPSSYLFRHFIFALAPGAVLGYIASRIRLNLLRKWAFSLLLISLFLMIVVFFPEIGIRAGGASRWINLGITSFQPSEFLKLSFILYLAAWLPSLTDKARNKSKTLAAFFAVIGLIGLLLGLQSDAGTLGVIAVTGLLMYFYAGTPLRHSLLIVFAGLSGLALLVKIAQYRLDRILVFLKPDIDPMGLGFQIKQALIAVGSGGIWGNGFGFGVEESRFLPHPMSDSIFAVFSEEAGFVGALILISLFLIFVWQGLRIARKVQDGFCRLASLGIVVWIALQAFVNMGSMLSLVPLAGIPLPFISYGGSAIVAELIGAGIIFNISRHAHA
jgi:cell division protein FtsW